jgi:hypothetical protein
MVKILNAQRKYSLVIFHKVKFALFPEPISYINMAGGLFSMLLCETGKTTALPLTNRCSVIGEIARW